MLGPMPSDNEVRPGSLGRDYGEVLREPGTADIERARITGYRRWLASDRGVTLAGGTGPAAYRELQEWSVAEPGAFWGSLWDYFGVLGERGDGPVLAGGPMPGASWFPGATVNYARNALRTADTDPARVAVIGRGEEGQPVTLTYAELAAEVARVRAGLAALGVTRGDRVAAFLPNIPAALIGLLATASLGAIWSSCSPDFGPHSVIDRFAQITPKVLLATGRYRYGGKEFDRRPSVAAIAAALPGLAAIVTVNEAGGAPAAPGITTVPFESLPGAPAARLEFDDVPFGHPLWILFSSGTTGLPKAIVHGHGGILIEQLKLQQLHMDLRPGDRMFFFTTTGWMMWNFLVSSLLLGVCPVLYDGSPTYPEFDVLWRLAEDAGVSFFGASPAYVDQMARAGIVPAQRFDLSSLRAIMPAGSPVSPECTAWFYENVKKDVWVATGSGGTDVCTGFVGGVPTLPVYAGEIQARHLGVAAYAFNAHGTSVTDEVGELVVTAPMPSMPVLLWGDQGYVRYR